MDSINFKGQIQMIQHGKDVEASIDGPDQDVANKVGHEEQDDPVGMLEERADLASSFAGRPELSLAGSQSGDEIVPVKLQPQQIHSDNLVLEGDTLIKREDRKNSKDCSVDDVEVEDRILMPAKTKSEMHVGKEANLTNSKLDYAQQKATLQHADDGSSHAVRVAQSTGGGLKSLAGSRSGTVTGAESAAFGGGNLQVEQSDHTVGSKTALQGLLPGRVALRGAMGNIAIDFMHDELDGNLYGQAARTAQKSVKKLTIQHQKLNHDKNKTFLDHDKFERACCAKEAESASRQPLLATVNYNQIKFDPAVQERPHDFAMWTNLRSTKSGRTTATRHRQRFQHRQFVSRVANNQSRSQALTRHRGFHTVLYRTKQEQHRKHRLHDEEARDFTAQTTEEEILNLEAGIVNNLDSRSKKNPRPNLRPPGGRRLKSANATTQTAKASRAKYVLQKRKHRVTSQNATAIGPRQEAHDYQEEEPGDGRPVGMLVYPHSLFVQTKTQERMQNAEGTAAISDLASSGEGLLPQHQAPVPGLAASNSAANSVQSKVLPMPAVGQLTAPHMSSTEGKSSSRNAAGMENVEMSSQGAQLGKRGSMPVLDPPSVAGSAQQAAKQAGSVQIFDPDTVDMADPNGSVSPQSPVADQLQGSKLEPLMPIDLERYLKIIAESEENREPEGQMKLIEELKRLNSQELLGVEAQIDQELLKGNAGVVEDNERLQQEERSKHLKQLLKATNEQRRGLRAASEEEGAARTKTQERECFPQGQQPNSRAESRNNEVAESRTQLENRYLRSSAQAQIFGLPTPEGRAAVMVTDGSQDYLISQALPNSRLLVGPQGHMSQGELSLQANHNSQKQDVLAAGGLAQAAQGSTSSNHGSQVQLHLANSTGGIETQDQGIIKSQDMTSGLSGRTASNSKLHQSPNKQAKEQSGRVLAMSHHTQNVAQPQSHDNLLEGNSSRKGPMSPLRVVVSSTTKVPDLLANQYGLSQQPKNMLKVQNIINSQSKQFSFNQNEQRRSIQHKTSNQRPKRNTRLATAKVRGTNYLKPEEASGPRASHIVMKDYKSGAQMAQEYLDITLLGGEPRSSGAMTSKAATNPITKFQDTTSDSKTGYLAGADLSEVDPSRIQTSSQRILGFNVEEEYRLYQQKLLLDEEGQLYRYNLDRSYETGTKVNPETEAALTPSNAGQVNSCVNIATFASNAKGKMEIKPAATEEGPASRRRGRNMRTPKRMRSQKEFVLNNRLAAQSRGSKTQSKSLTKVCQSFAATNAKLCDLQNRNKDPSEPELDLSANIAIRQLEGIKAPTQFHNVVSFQVYHSNPRSPDDHFHSSPNVKLAAHQGDLSQLIDISEGHRVIAQLPNLEEPREPWSGTLKQRGTLKLQQLQLSGSLKLAQRKGSTPGTAQLGGAHGTTFDRSRGSSPGQIRSTQRRDSHFSRGSKRRKKSTSHPDSPETFARTQVEKFSSLDPQACPPQYQRGESFGRNQPDMTQTATYVNSDQEVGTNETKLAVITAPNIIIPQTQTQTGSFILHHTQTEKASDPSSTLKQAILVKQPGNSPGLVPTVYSGAGVATHSGFAATQSGFGASHQSFQMTDVGNIGRLMPHILKQRELNQTEDLNRHPDTEKTHLVQASQEDELNRSQQLLGDLSTQKKHSINDMTGKTEELKDALKDAINIQDDVQVEEGPKQNKVPVDVQGMKRKSTEEEELEESSSLQYAEGIQMHQKPINDKAKKSIDSLNEMDPDGENESPAPERIPKARYTAIKPDEVDEDRELEEQKRHLQPIPSEKAAAASGHRSGRPSGRHLKNNSYREGSRVDQRKGLATTNEANAYNIEPLSPPEPQKAFAGSSKKPIESKASEEKSQRRYASKSLSSKSVHTRGKKGSSPLSALKPYTQVGPSPISAIDSPPNAAADLGQNIITVVNGVQLPPPDAPEAAGERGHNFDYQRQPFQIEQARDVPLAFPQSQMAPDLDPYAVNVLNIRRGNGSVADEPNGADVSQAGPGRQQRDEPSLKTGQRVTSEMDNQQLAHLMSLEGMVAEAPDRALVPRAVSAGGRGAEHAAEQRPQTAPFHHNMAGTAQVVRPTEGTERIVLVRSPKDGKLENGRAFKKAVGLFHPSRSDSRMGSSYKAGSLKRMHSSGKYEEFSVAEMSAQVMLDQHDGITDFSQLNASKQIAAGPLLSPPGPNLQANLNATQPMINQQNIITINSVGRTDLNDRESEFEEERLDGDSQRIKRGLYELLLQALQDQESKQKETISKMLEKSVSNFIFKNQAEISRLLVQRPANSKQYKYYEKQLSANPQQNAARNLKGLRRQDDTDVFIRHIQNDKETQLGRTQFGVQGRRLTSIRQNILQQQICSFIEKQIRILKHAHSRQESVKGKSSFEVNMQGNHFIQSLQEQLQEMPKYHEHPNSTMMNSTRRTVILNQRLNESIRGEFPNQVQHLFTALGQGASDPPETLTGGARGEFQTGTQGTLQNTRPPTESRTHHIKVERPSLIRNSQNSFRGLVATRLLQQEATSRSRISRSRETSSFTQMPRESVQKKDLRSAVNTGIVRSSGSRDMPYTSSMLVQPLDKVKSVQVPASPRSKGRRTFSRIRKQEKKESVGPGADLMNLDFVAGHPAIQSAGQKSIAGPQKSSYAISATNGEEGMQQVTGVGILKSTRMNKDGQIIEALELKEESQEGPRQIFSNQITHQRRHSQIRQSSGESGLFQREESGRSPYQSEVYQSSAKALSAVAHTTRANQARHSVGSVTRGSGGIEAKPNLGKRATNEIHEADTRPPAQEGIKEELSVVKEHLTSPVKKIHVRTSREQPESPKPTSKEAITRSSREDRLGVEYPNIQKGLLSKTAGSAKVQNEQDPDQIVTLPLHLLAERNAAHPREKNHIHSLSMRNDQDEKFVQATAKLHPDHHLGDQNMLFQDQEQPKKLSRSRRANAGATKTSKESLKKMTINESEQQISNYRITRPVMEGSPMAFAGYGTGNSNELTEKMLLGALSPPSAASGKQALVQQSSPAYASSAYRDIFDSKNNIRKPDELQASADRFGKSNTEGSFAKSKPAFKTLGSSKSDGKDDAASKSQPDVVESQRVQARQALRPNEKMQLTVNLNDPRMANAQLKNVARQGRPGKLSHEEEQKLQRLSRSTLMEKIGKSFQTQSFCKRTPAELKGQLSQHKRAAQARQALAVSHGQAAVKAVSEAPGVFDAQVSRTNLLINKTSRLNQRLMSGPGGQAQNVIGSLASVTAYIAPASTNLPAHMPAGLLNQPSTQTTVMPHQRQVNYLVRHPTTHEMSGSRLIENSRVRRHLPSGHIEPALQAVPKASRLHSALPERIKSAIHRGHVGLSYGVREPRKPATGLIPYKPEERTHPGKRSSAWYAAVPRGRSELKSSSRPATSQPSESQRLVSKNQAWTGQTSTSNLG